jgi:hypothetical protein
MIVHSGRRAQLLDPLTHAPNGVQYLDDDGSGEIGIVATTYPDGSV